MAAVHIGANDTAVFPYRCSCFGYAVVSAKTGMRLTSIVIRVVSFECSCLGQNWNAVNQLTENVLVTTRGLKVFETGDHNCMCERRLTPAEGKTCKHMKPEGI